MAHRASRRYYSDGTHDYRIESNTFLGFPFPWHTAHVIDGLLFTEAIFKSLTDACLYYGEDIEVYNTEYYDPY